MNTVSYLLLQVHDGRMETDPLIGRYCGNSLPAPIHSSSNFLWVRFRSDSSVSQAGFRAVYTVGEIPHIWTHVIWYHVCFVYVLYFISEIMPVLFNSGVRVRVMGSDQGPCVICVRIWVKIVFRRIVAPGQILRTKSGYSVEYSVFSVCISHNSNVWEEKGEAPVNYDEGIITDPGKDFNPYSLRYGF